MILFAVFAISFQTLLFQSTFAQNVVNPIAGQRGQIPGQIGPMSGQIGPIPGQINPLAGQIGAGYFGPASIGVSNYGAGPMSPTGSVAPGNYGYGSYPGYAYGGSGSGDVSVVGELPVAGTTNLAGQVPVIGTVQFGGPVAASGAVTISGSCACNLPYGY